jgi:hypothetical protein
MFSSMRRGVKFPTMVLALAIAAWVVTGSSAFAKGGGGGGHGGGGGGHGGGGHGGGGFHGGGYRGGGYRGGGHYGGGYRRGGIRYYNNYYPFFYSGGYYYGYPGYGYGSYNDPYYNYGYTYPNYVYDNSTPYAAPSQGRYLGIDERAVADAGGQGMQVVRVYAGSPAERAGLQPGDVIYSANGYYTQQHGNLTWIISTVPSNGALQMNVRSARDGAMRMISAQMP